LESWDFLEQSNSSFEGTRDPRDPYCSRQSNNSPLMDQGDWCPCRLWISLRIFMVIHWIYIIKSIPPSLPPHLSSTPRTKLDNPQPQPPIPPLNHTTRHTLTFGLCPPPCASLLPTSQQCWLPSTMVHQPKLMGCSWPHLLAPTM
jgi:hypothetical protein